MAQEENYFKKVRSTWYKIVFKMHSEKSDENQQLFDCDKSILILNLKSDYYNHRGNIVLFTHIKYALLCKKLVIQQTVLQLGSF